MPYTKESFFCIAGPCVIEGRDFLLKTAERLAEDFLSLGLPWIFKSSFDKANRTSAHSFRGVGIEEGLRFLEEVKNTFGVPIVTDIHHPYEAAVAGEVCDVLQIPAFLCRQTDLLQAAARTGRVVEVKKGQFLAPSDMAFALEKVVEAGGEDVWLVERGTFFGYNQLVCDFAGFQEMKKLGVPVGFDATHSVQKPGARSGSSGGAREYITPLSAAAIAAGADFLFFEAHPNPQQALSDRETQLSLDEVKPYLEYMLFLKNMVASYAQPLCAMV